MRGGIFIFLYNGSVVRVSASYSSDLRKFLWSKSSEERMFHGTKVRRSGRTSPPDVTSFFSHSKHNRCIYSRKQGNMNWFFRYWHIFMQYINLQISTTQLKITVIEYVTNRRSTHLQLHFVRLGQTVRFTKPQT